VPNNYAISSIKQVLNIDYLDEELRHREELRYPPFSRLVIIELTSEDLAELSTCVNRLYSLFPKDKPEIEVLPPADPVVSRVRKKYRKIIVIKNDKNLDPNGRLMRKHLITCINHYTKQYGSNRVRVNVNVDASSVM
jgi:primosomal protein N' (replication factor Y)